MRIVLAAVETSLADAWHRHCGDLDCVTVHRGSILDVACDALVSPANSFGFMDGGIDSLYSHHFGWEVQERPQELIRTRHRGELLVGTAEIVETGSPRAPFLIAAPTMRVPMILRDSVNPYPPRGITKSRVREFERRRGIRVMPPVQAHQPAHEAEEYPAMNESTIDIRIVPLPTGQDVLTQVLRDGARKMLAQAVEAEVATWIADPAHLKDESGRRQVVRNGHLPERAIQTGLGPIEVEQPRVRDRRPADQREAFTSAILPPYLRKTKSLEELIPWLYLKGVSTGDFSEALQALLGPEAPGLSATTITRLKAVWEAEHEAWSKRSLAGKHYVYVWADGVHFDIRLEEGRQCILVLMGATADGKKERIAIADGYRESEQSWKELLLDCKARGLEIEPSLAIGDGALGFWKAMRQVWDETKEQRCWVHKTANALDKLPKGSQAKAKGMLHEIDLAETKEAARKAFDLFVATYGAKYPKATGCLEKDRDVLLAFYDFPAERWVHIRTTNPIESVFATVRLRHDKTKGNGSRAACLAMVYKLMESASRSWRSLNGSPPLAEVIKGTVFIEGIREKPAA